MNRLFLKFTGIHVFSKSFVTIIKNFHLSLNAVLHYLVKLKYRKHATDFNRVYYKLFSM